MMPRTRCVVRGLERLGFQVPERNRRFGASRPPSRCAFRCPRTGNRWRRALRVATRSGGLVWASQQDSEPLAPSASEARRFPSRTRNHSRRALRAAMLPDGRLGLASLRQRGSGVCGTTSQLAGRHCLRIDCPSCGSSGPSSRGLGRPVRPSAKHQLKGADLDCVAVR
jgi:hypothetical protein